jgi:hypothetical protein
MRTRRHLAVHFAPTDDTGAGQPQAGGAAQPQAGTQAGGQAPPAGNGQAPASGAQQGTGAGTDAGGTATESDADKAARLERENAELRRENAGHRTKLTAAERAAAQAAQAGMTELERAQADAAEQKRLNTELTERLQNQAVQAATVAAATKLNFRNPELAYRLLDRSAIEFNDKGEARNVEHLLREIATADPYLLKPAGADFGGGNRGGTPDGQPTDMNTLMKAALGRG